MVGKFLHFGNFILAAMWRMEKNKRKTEGGGSMKKIIAIIQLKNYASLIYSSESLSGLADSY